MNEWDAIKVKRIKRLRQISFPLNHSVIQCEREREKERERERKTLREGRSTGAGTGAEEATMIYKDLQRKTLRRRRSTK